jgi:manganese transport system substrate-binding protein
MQPYANFPKGLLGPLTMIAVGASWLVLVGLGACTPLPPGKGGGPDGKKVVLTSFTVLADMARNVAGDRLTVESITRVGSEIHGYEPTPSDLTRAQQAELILYNGLELERWAAKFLGKIRPAKSVQVSAGIAPIAIASGPYANRPNPHAWMSPQNALIYVENIRKAFTELDPANAAHYNANAAQYSNQLRRIDQQLRQDLAQIPPTQRTLVTCEGAFSYLARDYGLQELYLWPINAEQQVSPKQMQLTIDQVKARQVPAVFCETTVNDSSQRQVAKTAGSSFGGNLYVDSLSPPEGPVPTYLALLEYDARTITQGLKPASTR